MRVRAKSWIEKDRQQRRHKAGEEDQRTNFERDRDRVLYSSALRRLAGISQVVSAEHIEPFHNHLTQTIKVAQLGRRILIFLQITRGSANLLGYRRAISADPVGRSIRRSTRHRRSGT